MLLLMRPSSYKKTTFLFFSTLLVFLGMSGTGCVSRKLYQEKSAALSRIDSLYFISQRKIRALNEELDELRLDTASCNNEVRELLDRFSNLNERNSAAIRKLEKENAALKKKLTGYKVTISRYTIDWRDMRQNMLVMDSVLATFGYRLDTLLQGSSMQYRISRELEEVLLTLEKADLLRRPGQMSTEADKTFLAIQEFLKEFPQLEPVYHLHAREDIKFVTMLSKYLNSPEAPFNIHISKNETGPMRIGIGFRLKDGNSAH